MAQPSLFAPEIPAAETPAVSRASLGAFIISEIARCSGPQLPNYQEQDILDGFWERFGSAGMVICERAFGVYNGMWRGAPITLLRFQPRHDVYFAIPLLEEIHAGQETINSN
jgi:hypothetical protein